MQTQWEVFAKKIMLAQGQRDGQAECMDDSDDFENLDENFPLKVEPNVEELEWSIQKELTFKRRMVNNLIYKFFTLCGLHRGGQCLRYVNIN